MDLTLITDITPTAAAMALLSPEGIVLAGYVLAVLIRQYVSDRDVFDFDAELFGTDIDVDIDPDHGIPILGEFTFTEQAVIVLSLYYQYAVVSPETGLQSLLASASSLILFGIFVDHLVNRYLVDRDD